MPGQVVENRTEALDAQRRMLLQMLFVEGNHFCPSCEKSGDCLLQAHAYALGMLGPRFEEFHPNRPVDASHPDVWLDLNRDGKYADDEQLRTAPGARAWRSTGAARRWRSGGGGSGCGSRWHGRAG